MNEDVERRSEGADSRPLPGEWLPDPSPPEDHIVWQTRTARILAAAERERTARSSVGIGAAPWLSEMGGWLRPAAVLAAAAVALVFLLPDAQARFEPAGAAAEMALGLVAAGGEPAALWATLGVPADPILALLTLEDHSALIAGTGPTDPAEGEIR
jgi:hypothetical protein